MTTPLQAVPMCAPTRGPLPHGYCLECVRQEPEATEGTPLEACNVTAGAGRAYALPSPQPTMEDVMEQHKPKKRTRMPSWDMVELD